MPRLRQVDLNRVPVSGIAAPARHRAGRLLLALATSGLLLLALVPATPVAAVDGLTMDAHALLQGHVRSGGWFGIAVDLQNDGPTITGELRISGGVDSRTRFSTPVELATGSRKQYLLYAQPPTFGGNMTVSLVSGEEVLDKVAVAIALHDQQQLVVGVVSENPGRIIGQLDLLPSQSGHLPTVVPLTPSDLPERLQAWSVLDRLVWQDEDTAALKPAQLAALRGWIAGGGRLVIVGGTAGADALTGLPDELLPYRPTAVLDVDPEALRPLLGGLPAGAVTLTAYAGDLTQGRSLATSGDRVIAAEMTRGAGSVTLIGFDPTTSWLADGDTWDAPLWRRLLPARAGSVGGLLDDSTIVSAVANLPSLALPPIGGLIVLLIGYIALVGPVNYLVLRAIDRREWAWITVPALIVVFTVGSFGFGAVLRGSDVIVHEVAIVRGAPGASDAVAQSYLGIFSPSRATFQLRAPGDTLLAAPMNGDVFGGDATGALDIVQGDPSRVRNLSVGFGSLRTVRAEASAVGPVVTSDLRLEGTKVVGTITNRSDRMLEEAAIVLGASSQRLNDVAPGATVAVEMQLAANPFGVNQLSDRIVGQVSFDGGQMSDENQRRIVRRSVIDQLTFDPMSGFANAIVSESPILLAWGRDAVVPLDIESERVRRLANVLYEIPLPFTIHGETTFSSDLIRSSVLEVDANFFSRDPWSINFGPGSIRMALQPIPFEGTLSPTRVLVAMGWGGDMVPFGGPQPLKETVRCDPADDGCVAARDGFPELEVLDRGSGAWVQFEHLQPGRAYELSDPARWVDPASGEVQVRFVNEMQDGVGFQFTMQLSGVVG